MANVAFDTLMASKDLQSVGIEVRQAEAIALIIKNSQGDLVTKSDLDNLRTELKSDILLLKWSIATMAAIMLGGFSVIISLLP